MRKKKPPEHENHERWLVSYADFITLLFAFFVVMFATSQVDSAKVGRFVESANVAFHYKGVFPQSSTHPIQGSEAGVSPAGRPQIVPSKISILPTSNLSKKGKDLRTTVEKMVQKSSLGGRVRIGEDMRGVTVSLTEAGFFDPGSAAIKTQSVPILRDLGEMLRDAETPIVVEGHTDNTPIRTPQYPSNWELSTARATSIVSYFIEKLGYEPSRLAIAGYSEFHPSADNSTPEGRAQNRRVDIVVLTEGSDGPPPRR